MKKIGIIAEYNPFHAGHAYQIRALREQYPDACIIVVMSGHFVQRGEPAIYDPHERASVALENGADAVFQMPICYSTASAADFADCGVQMLHGLGCDAISFGIEDNSIEELIKLAKTEGDSDELKKLLKEGYSYPAAVAKAFGLSLSGNNILAVEYIKSIYRNGYDMEVIPVNRIGHKYNDDTFDENYPSASAIRKILLADDADGCIGPDDFMPYINAVLSRLISESADLTQYMDVSEEIANRIKNTPLLSTSWEEYVLKLKTRQYTFSRIARCLIHILLNIKEKSGTYCLLLGFRKDCPDIFNNVSIPIISKAADFKEELATEAFAAKLWNQIYCAKHHAELPDFYAAQVIRM